MNTSTSSARRRWSAWIVAGALLGGAGGSASAAAQSGPVDAKPSSSATRSGGGTKALGEIGKSREPIAIDADRLDVFDKEGRAVFAGNVIAVQGETTMKCTSMNVFYESSRAGAGADKAAPADKKPETVGPLANDSSIRKIECSGPVTITTKSQTATGDRAEFDRVVNKVFLIGNAALSDGPNVTRGGRVAYDLTTGVAKVEGGRVQTLIVPGSQKDGDKAKDTKPKPR